MNDLERERLLASARLIKEREATPESFVDRYSDMTPEEKSKLIVALVNARQKDAQQIEEDSK